MLIPTDIKKKSIQDQVPKKIAPGTHNQQLLVQHSMVDQRSPSSNMKYQFQLPFFFFNMKTTYRRDFLFRMSLKVAANIGASNMLIKLHYLCLQCIDQSLSS